ncbi:hypothetical protein NAEGRDRAFT_46913 [Naegleria gruberi]|uniref:DUF4200 domain-containing protein n=1 Tax=Naegleria gruberi TaxID=5762 RepID=D2V5V3_NAEGR|nr:uncharacterized protein NAEGRDRAFT_46913 [Naegleria gruberi]EFC47715.1 hypothetical protein NAEGRDRAFT_46913 [Naegleria gruberi]|eukprot:XP_002680459.1 hypothetical protein NAEGRDRAFT_46913 [Naegleria gruberi strain NEG-M]
MPPTNTSFIEQEEPLERKEETGEDDSEKEEDNINSFSASTKLLEKRKEMMEVQSLLQQKRTEYLARMDAIKKKEKGLLGKKQELTENVKELDKFIGDNIIKKKRADQKKDIEQGERIKSEGKITDAKNDIDKLEKEKQFKESLLINHYIKYQQFLQKVVQFRGDDINPEDVEKVIDRYETLSEKNRELQAKKAKYSMKFTREKIRINEEKEMMKDKKVKLNHMISKLGKKLELMSDERGKITSKYDVMSTSQTKDRRQLGQIEMAINNVYNRVTTNGGSRIPRRCKISMSNNDFSGSSSKISTGSTHEVTVESYKRFNNMEILMKMLKVIGDCLSDYMAFAEMIKKMPEKDKEINRKQKT